MRMIFCVILLTLFCGQSFGMVYPVGNQNIKPTASFDSGNGYIITQQFLYVGGDGTHLGVDLAALNNASGGEVRSIDSGIVVHVQHSEDTTGWGTMVRIRHQLLDGTVYYSQYAHMLYESVTINAGDSVVKGQAIGKVGSTGYSTNPHLHFEVKKVDNNGCGYFPKPACPNDSVDNYYDPLEFIAAHSQAFDYPDFTSVAGLNLIGSALQDGNVLQLTSAAQLQTGAAWFAEKQYIQDGFETICSFWISNDGADGIAFVIQNHSDIALGATGGGLGYQNIPNSLAVEFDTWRNWAGDPEFYDYDVNDNHIGVHPLGTEPNSAGPHAAYPDALQGETTAIPFLSDGQIHTAKISYVSGTLSVYVDDLAAPVLEVPVAIASILSLDNGAAWVGLSSGTGTVTEIHDILSWSFATASSQPKPDLTASLAVSPAEPRVGDTATVNAKIFNGPDADAGPCQATVDFSGQTKTVDVPALPANGNFPFSVSFVLTTEGLQLAEVIADINDVISESNENNNIADAIVMVLPPLPDLTVSSLSASKQRGKLIVEVDVANIGTALAGYFGLRLEVLETGETATVSLGGLVAGETTIQTLTLKKAPKKILTLRAAVDPDSLIAESDETNNLLVVSQQL